MNKKPERKREYKWPRVWLLVLVGAFLLPAVTLIPSGAVGLGARFVAVALACIYVARANLLGNLVRRYVPLILGLSFYLFAMFSVSWSGYWPITLLKAGLGMATFLSAAGLGLVVGREGRDAAALIPLAVLGVGWALLSLLAVGLGAGWHPKIGLFEGACDNPNMFASVTAVLAVPTAVAFRRSNHRILRVLADAGWIASGFALLASGSRGGLLIWLSAVAFSSVGGSLGRTSSRLAIAVSILGLFAYVLGFGPVVDHVDSIIYKRDLMEAERDMFSSRRGPWEIAAASAAQAGLLGAGYGMFPGDLPDGLSWLTTVGYGFESGSGWYAVQMQLGYPGLALYVLIGVALISMAARQIRRGRIGEGDLSWTFIGVSVGLYLHSFFEAWMVSPGSPENALFWSVVGIAVGLQAKERLHQIAASRARFHISVNGVLSNR